jgi:hypothetical protein
MGSVWPDSQEINRFNHSKNSVEEEDKNISHRESGGMTRAKK